MLDYFIQNLWLVWTLICILGLILELSSGDFFVMCFALGAIVSAIAAACGLGWLGQIFVWVIASVVCLVFVRPFALRCLHRKEHDRPSNADALIGREGRVTEAIAPSGHGRVQVDGDYWKAVSHETTTIPEGTLVRIVGRESIIVTVEPSDPNSPIQQ